jgi:hypothetical protein
MRQSPLRIGSRRIVPAAVLLERAPIELIDEVHLMN